MNDMRKGWSGTAIAARAVAVVLVLVLACLAPQGMEARAPVLDAAEGGSAPPAGLSAGDWAAIQARLAQAGAHPPLMTSEVAKLTAVDAGEDDEFGFSVAVSEDTVVVGAWKDDSFAGSAYVFERNFDPDNPSQPSADNWGQVQKLTADYPAAEDYFGISVAISGDTVVVGAWGDDDGGDDSGSAFVFERNQDGPDHWGQVQKLTADGGTFGDLFGASVDISGDTVVAGAWGDENASGSVYVFERNYNPGNPGTPLADNWGQVQRLTADDPAAVDKFGLSVAISGDTVIVGAPQEDGGPGDPIPNAGAAYVFERNQGGADNWGRVKKLMGSAPLEFGGFGLSVAISGDTVIVGAPQEDGGPDDQLPAAGAAYVFERNQGGADNWGQVQRLTAGDGAAGDTLGRSVSISGDTVIVGVFWDDDGGESSGSAYLFERNQGGMDSWGQVEKLTASDAETDDLFGWSVAISGNTVVAGAYGDDDAGDWSGSAYVFARRGAAWPQQQKPTAYGAAADDRFGTSVAVSGDAFIAGAADSDRAYIFYRNEGGAERWGCVSILYGAGGSGFGNSVSISGDTAVVGAPDVDRAYVYERNDSGVDQWGYVRTLYGAVGSGFGNSVSISGDTAVVGAPHDDVAGSDCGAAYVYERNLGGAENWGLRAVLTGYLPEGGDNFGRSVAISGDTVVVGAPNDTYFGKSHVGSVYVFKRNYDADHPTTPKADNWGLVRYVTSSDAAEWDLFGFSVAISGDTFVVGASGDDNYTGAAYVFERNHFGWEDWSQVERLTADGGAIGDFFGWSVGIGGDTVVVGAFHDDDGGDGSGSAYLFKRNAGGADAWGQVEKLTAADAAEDDWFGYSVSISGNTVVVGAPYDDDGGDASGSTYVFRWAAAEVYLPLVLKD